MQADAAARWQRIAAHPIGGDEAAFARRIANTLALDEAAARALILEYRRFVFLACLGEEVTPSKAVDAAWHEHLLHTRDYWTRFCPQVLGMPLHHAPGGGPGDEARYAAQYRRTLAAYEAHFGTPPARWWPRRAAPPADVAKPRASVRGLGIAAALAAVPVLALAAVRPANPLDWTGPEFLLLYLALMAVVLIGSPLWRRWLRSRAAPPRDAGTLSPLEAGYLAGGPARAVDAGVAALHHRGVLKWDARTERFEVQGSPERLDAPLRALAEVFTARNARDGVARGQAAVAPVRRKLEQRGLHECDEDARRIGRLSALPAFALLLFGIAKIVVGVQRERPVATLAILCVIVALFALAMLFGRAQPTRAGRQALARTKAAARTNAKGRVDDIALAVAFGGTALLAGTALAGYHDVRAPRPDGSSSSDTSSSGSPDSSDSSGDSGGSDSGGSSCGGCGGGGGD